MTQGKTTGLIPVRRGYCEACNHADHAQILKRVYDGTLTNGEASKQLNVSLQVWYRHIKNHVKPQVESAIAPDVGDITKTIVDKVEELVGQVDRVKDNLERVNKAIAEDDEIDFKKMQSWLQAERQLTYILETLGKFNGDLQNSAVININQTKIEFNTFRENVLDTVCTECKSKLVKSL